MGISTLVVTPKKPSQVQPINMSLWTGFLRDENAANFCRVNIPLPELTKQNVKNEVSFNWQLFQFLVYYLNSSAYRKRDPFIVDKLTHLYYSSSFYSCQKLMV